MLAENPNATPSAITPARAISHCSARKDKATKTGPGALLLVAIEQAFPERERIITDELAFPLLPVSSTMSDGCRLWTRRFWKTESLQPS